MTGATILVGTWNDGVFAFSHEGHAHELAGKPVRGLTADGRGGALAVVAGTSLCRRSPDGCWTTLARSDRELACCKTAGDTLYAGTEDARLLRLSYDGTLEPNLAFDEVPGRDTWFAGSAMVNGQRLGPPLGIRSLAANATGEVLFANVHVGGIARSCDAGRSWHPTVDIHYDVHEVCTADHHPEVVVAAAGAGLCISLDLGETWTLETEALEGLHCYAVAISGDDMLFSAAESPFTKLGRVYRRSIRPTGSMITALEGMDRSVDTACIATRGGTVAIADKEGNLYVSSDRGRSWACTQTGLPSPSCVLLC
jgi:hypothetical protein